MKKLYLLIFCALCITLTLTFPVEISAGIKKGTILSLYSVIPSLLPFILITNYMYEKGLCYYIGKLLYPLLNFFFKVTINGAYIILVGFLSGYPLGAKVIGEMVSSGNISKAEGKYLITFCNNTSISFLINYIICTCLKSSLPVLGDTKLTTLHIVLFVFLPSIITGILNKLILNFRETHYPTFQTSINTLNKNENIIKKTYFSLMTLCTYVIFFSALTQLINIIPLSFFQKNIAISFLEITNGCFLITKCQLEDVYKIYFMLLFVILGGISIFMQSLSQIKDKSIMLYYVLGKIECCLFFTILYLIIYSL